MGNGSISDAHTGVMPESKPPRGKPPEPSKRLPRVSLFIWYLHLFYKVGVHYLFSVSLHKNILRRDAILHGPAEDNRCVLLVQFHHAADPVHLFTGHHGGAAAAEGVDHHGILLGRIPDGIP